MNSLIERDLKHIWHPCMQMKDFEQSPPFIVHKAKGSILYTDQGEIIDALSSWWCKSLGHGHPAVLAAMKEQLDSFEHIIAANTTHPKLVALGEKLSAITRKQHVSFASDGSSAVEIALKLSLHAQLIKGNSERRTFISLHQAYHGETLGTLSVSDLGIYKAPYQDLGAVCHFIDPSPFFIHDESCMDEENEEAWQKIKHQMEAYQSTAAALIVEPLIQGSGGMRIYSGWFLRQLSNWAREHGIYFITDEIMTGMGRTGRWLAADHAGVEADLICLSKGLSGGTVPFSAVMIDHSIYELFYHDYREGKSFLHSHTHSGNALGVAAALATLETIEREDILLKTRSMGEYMFQVFSEIARETQKLKNLRCLGGVIAGDLIECPHPRAGYKLHQEALKRGAYLRPLGQTLYWMPPLNTDHRLIGKLAEITLDSIYAVYN